MHNIFVGILSAVGYAFYISFAPCFLVKIFSLIINKYKWTAAGIGFAILWASASTATKIALEVAQPLVIAQVRFAMAGIIMLIIGHFFFKSRLPSGANEWSQLTIYALLNITVYLGCYVIAMQEVTAGVGALAVATNPLFISFLSIIFLRKKLKPVVIIALVLGTAGVVTASLPLLEDASVTTKGLILLLVGMLSYSLGAIYFSAKKWNGLSLLVINGWQTMIGGILLLPFTLYHYLPSENDYDLSFWINTGWLAIPVSIFAAQLWLWLLQTNTVRAGLWLFLCPIFGFAIAAPVMGDPVGIYTICGVLFVMIGLFLARRKQSGMV